MNSKIIFAGVAIALTPQILDAQVQVGANAEADARVEARGGFDEQNGGSSSSARAEANVAAAARAGLPTRPVELAIAEGRTKHAGEAEIARAASATVARLELTRAALRTSDRQEPTHAEIIAGAEAIAAGAGPDHLERVSEQAPSNRSLEASLRALANLTLQGGDPGRAASTVAASLSAGANDQAIAALGATMSRVTNVAGSSTGGGASVGAAADAALNGVTGSIGTGASVVGGLGLP